MVTNLSKIISEYDRAYLQLEPVHLPETTKRKVLIFDIDETMVHSIDESDPKGMKGKIHLLIPGQKDTQSMVPVCLNVRPHLMKCLYTLKDKFQMVAFSASEATYADTILNFLDPNGEIFEHRLYRHNCVLSRYGLIKDLRVIKNRNLKDMLIIDNSCLSFSLNLNNGVPILPFHDNLKDDELTHLLFYLSCLQENDVYDVREHNKDAFGLMKMAQSHVES